MAFHKKLEKDWFTVEEVANKYGFSRSFIINQIKTNRLSAFHPGRDYRINKNAIELWIKENSNELAS